MTFSYLAYTMAKYGMSMCVLGMAEEFKEDGIAVNALWPKTGKSNKTKLLQGLIYRTFQISIK
jgi:NAD(P)-dependent dehydrogenase (short-subunit alcohol dehydrogenase family)